MRYYLDTNILIFYHDPQHSELTDDVFQLLTDYENILYTSSVCVQEMIHLCEIGKIGNDKYDKYEAGEILQWLKENDIRIVPVEERHLEKYAEMPMHEEHRDPNDRMIIAQAIVDKVPVISSDCKFGQYAEEGLEFVQNER